MFTIPVESEVLFDPLISSLLARRIDVPFSGSAQASFELLCTSPETWILLSSLAHAAGI
jgi:hypothetical protein